MDNKNTWLRAGKLDWIRCGHCGTLADHTSPYQSSQHGTTCFLNHGLKFLFLLL